MDSNTLSLVFGAAFVLTLSGIAAVTIIVQRHHERRKQSS